MISATTSQGRKKRVKMIQLAQNKIFVVGFLFGSKSISMPYWAWLLLVTIVTAAITFLFTRWINQKDKIDEKHEEKINRMDITLATLSTNMSNCFINLTDKLDSKFSQLPCISEKKTSGGNSVPSQSDCEFAEKISE